MTRSLRPGVDGLHALDDPADRCVCCSEPLAPTEGVAYAGGWACGDCIDPPARCALCDEPGQLEPWNGTNVHAGCRDDYEQARADSHMAVHS